MKNLAIFASGSGTNAENIARLFHQGNRIRVSVVLCNRKQAGVYSRMEAFGVPVIYMPNSSWESDPQRVIDTLRPYSPDLIVLAGFMRAVRPEIIDAFGGNVINIHPSLLPAYGGKGMYGHHVHEAVIAAHDTRSGVTVHYVTSEIDGGEIIMQQEVEVTPDDTAETLEAKIHPVEYDLYPRAIVKALAACPDTTDEEPAAKAASHPAEAGAVEPPVMPVPDSSASPDEQWARTLHINNYSDAKAERALEHAQATTPPPMASTPQRHPSPASHTIGSYVHPEVRRAMTEGRKLPKSYMWVSIVMTVLFSTIPGIVAIVYSASVSSRLSSGDIAGAEKASRNAQGWIIASFVLGVLSATLWVPLQIIASMS